jgi:hypothetical protein
MEVICKHQGSWVYVGKHLDKQCEFEAYICLRCHGWRIKGSIGSEERDVFHHPGETKRLTMFECKEIFLLFDKDGQQKMSTPNPALKAAIFKELEEMGFKIDV